MDPVLKQVKDILDEVCVTLILNTHRTHPESDKDALVLKNLQKEAENILLETQDKRQAASIIERIDALVSGIDHRLNIESLVVFVSETVALYTRLPIAVNDRAVVDRSFVTRDLIRATHLRQTYYTLLLGQDRVRLIEAADGRVIEELGRPFPMTNKPYFVPTRMAMSNAKRIDNFQREFFKRVDDALWGIWREDPHPVIVAADEKTFSRFKEVSEHNDIIIAVHNDKYDKPAQQIVDANWHLVEEYNRKKNEERIVELKKSLDSGRVLFDVNDIWMAIHEGRGETLFVRNGYYLPAKIVDDRIVPLSEEDAKDHDTVDDIIDEMIEVNTQYGGDAVFIFDGGLDAYGGLALVIRY